MSNPEQRFESDVAERLDIANNAPGSFNVILHNDDYTTMDFVREILQSIFYHTPAAAAQLMLLVHNQGRAVAGTFTKDIAETKAAEAAELARKQGFPLKCTVEPAS